MVHLGSYWISHLETWVGRAWNWPGIACTGIKERLTRDYTELVWSKEVPEKRIQKRISEEPTKASLRSNHLASPKTQHEATSQGRAGLHPSLSIFYTHASLGWACTNNWQVEENVSMGWEGAEGYHSSPLQKVREGSFNTVTFSVLKF